MTPLDATKLDAISLYTCELTEAPWKAIPSTYVICAADDLPLALQEGWAKRTDRALRMNTSHSPFLSRPPNWCG